MKYYLVEDKIFDEHLRLLVTLTENQHEFIHPFFEPLDLKWASRFLDTLWLETYAFSRGKPPEGEVSPRRSAGGTTYEWLYNILKQVTPCGPRCERGKSHKHIGLSQIKKRLKRDPIYGKLFRLRRAVDRHYFDLGINREEP